jgi:hypothetical protein
MLSKERWLIYGRVRSAVQSGKLKSPKELPCADCQNQAVEYDHYLGYDLEHVFDVQAVCKSCHAKREFNRGKLTYLPAFKEKSRLALIGRKLSEEHKRNIGIGCAGKNTAKRGPMPDWIREKIRHAHLGKPKPWIKGKPWSEARRAAQDARNLCI